VEAAYNSFLVPDTGDYIILFLLLCLVAFVAVMIWDICRHLRRRQSAAGAPVCPVCGYDLRASSESCPECGMPVALNKLRVPLNAARLNKQWPADRIDPRKPAKEERMACVQAADVGKYGQLLADQLKARGVWAELRPGPEDCVLVLVPAADTERADAIVATFRLT
jgi:predicted amidophosphoribosyltransferase